MPAVRAAAEKRNIGIRAREVVHGYLAFVRAIQETCDAAGISSTDIDVGGYSKAETDYKGWWTFPLLGRLANVSPVTMTYDEFLSRCKDIFRLFEGLKPGPLRSLLRKLGIPKAEVDAHEGLKLSGFLCQLASIAEREHWNLITDAQLIIGQWDKDLRLDCYKPFFALYGLRQVDAHASSTGSDPKAQLSKLKEFGIDPDKFKPGWGHALDQVYDSTAKSLEEATALLEAARDFD